MTRVFLVHYWTFPSTGEWGRVTHYDGYVRVETTTGHWPDKHAVLELLPERVGKDDVMLDLPVEITAEVAAGDPQPRHVDLVILTTTHEFNVIAIEFHEAQVTPRSRAKVVGQVLPVFNGLGPTGNPRPDGLGR